MLVARASLAGRRVIRAHILTVALLSPTAGLAGRSGPKLPPLVELADAPGLTSAHYFSETANWLVPGRVLVGRHPSAPGPLVERLRALRQAGVHTFVDLVMPAEEQGMGECATDEGGCVPYAAVASSIDARPTAFIRFPIEDMQPAPTLESLAAHVDELRRRVLDDSEILFVHCWGGRGRTGIVAACLLGALYDGLGAEEALERVQAYYLTRGAVHALPPGKRTSPETEPQRQQVRDWFRLRGGARGGGARGGGAPRHAVLRAFSAARAARARLPEGSGSGRRPTASLKEQLRRA